MEVYNHFSVWAIENTSMDMLVFEKLGKLKTRAQIQHEELESKFPKDKIREIFTQKGFTIKEDQTDLKDYVYDAAYALLRELQPPSLPKLRTVVSLTPEALKMAAAHMSLHKTLYCQLQTSDGQFLNLPATIGPVFGDSEGDQYCISLRPTNAKNGERIVFIEGDETP